MMTAHAGSSTTVGRAYRRRLPVAPDGRLHDRLYGLVTAQRAAWKQLRGGNAMPRSTTPAGPGPAKTTGNPAISGVGTGMGAGNATGPGVVGGVQAGTVNDAAQGASTGDAADPSLGSGMAVSEQGNRMGDAATAGAPGMGDKPLGIGGAPIESHELPYKVVIPPSERR